MIKKETLELSKQAIDRFGIRHELLKSVEELSELTTVLMQFLNGKIVDLNDIHSEIADVYICLAHLYNIYVPSAIDDALVAKQKRLKDLLN